MSKQIIYYGTNCKIEKPSIIKGKYNKDFGEGFYCTVIRKQAIRWAKKYDTPMVNIYEYNQNNNLKIKEFTMMSEEWLDFIISSRNGQEHSYDIVIGPMADDQIYNYISDLIDGVITREAFWELAKFKYPTHQIVFCTDKALDTIRYIDCQVNFDE